MEDNEKVYVLADKEDSWTRVYLSKERLEADFYDDMVSSGYNNFDDYWEAELKYHYYIDHTSIVR